jgi:tripartite-type tricarboxylate transporter receptor subunit TctC
MTTCLRWLSAVLAGCLFAGAAAAAQSYPSRAVRMVVPFGAGGVTDVLARILAERMSVSWGQPVVVEARPGGNTMIGTEVVLNAPADGYTLLMVAQTHAANAALYPDLRWDPARDFTGAGLFARTVPFFVVPVTLPVKDMAEFIALAKSQPGKLDYGHSGLGSPPHLSVELFKRIAGVDLQAVPYKGNATIMTDLLSGRLSAALLSAVSTTSHARAGKIKQLAVMDSKRAKAFPDVPTIVEAGYPEAQTQSWFGVVMNSKTPRDVVKRVTDEIEKAAKAPEMFERLEKAGAEVSFLNSQEFDALIRKDIATWTRVVREAGIKPE